MLGIKSCKSQIHIFLIGTYIGKGISHPIKNQSLMNSQQTLVRACKEKIQSTSIENDIANYIKGCSGKAS